MNSLGELVLTSDGSYSLMHPVHLESYHSNGGAKWEAFRLYCDFSGIKEALVDHKSTSICILDVGLGLAYNACASIETWSLCHTDKNLLIHSLECDLELVLKGISGEAQWQKNWPSSWTSFLSQFKRLRDDLWEAHITHPLNESVQCVWRIHVADAKKIMNSRERIPHQSVNFIWQDPFSPEKNPSMWNREWFATLAEVAADDCILMTYSVARSVRDALSESSWEFEKIKTGGHKKHWLRAKRQATHTNEN